MKDNFLILSLGGSLVVPEKIDLNFLKKFKKVIIKFLKKGKKFFILVGGGKIARLYQNVLLEFNADSRERDWAGINISRLNAQILKKVFSDFCYERIIVNPKIKVNSDKPILIGAGYKPGWSTDYVSVLVAKTYKVRTVINLSNIDYVYDKDPREFSKAKPFKKISWQEFRAIIGDKWSPGLSTPFDPRASKLAQSLGMEVAVINGRHLERLEKFLDNKPFIGTIIQ